MNAIQHDTIGSNLTLDETSFKDLIDHFRKISACEKELDKALELFYGCLHNVAQRQPQDKMKALVEQFSHAIKAVHKLRTDATMLIDLKIIGSLNGQIEQVKAKRIILNDFIAKRTVEQQREEQRNQNKDETKSKELYQRLENSKIDSKNAGEALKTQYNTYVGEKNAEFKAMLQHYLNSLLVIAAMGLQEYSKVAQSIVNMDEKAETDQFVSKMLGTFKAKN